MAIQVRRGNEVDFDAEKMLPGEWAVSLDTKYVRMCFSPGVCLRMATYEAFEADMAQIQAILEEAQTIEEAIQRVSAEVSENAVLVEEYTAEAKLYRDEAKQYRDEAFTLAPEGYENIMQDVEELRNQIVGSTSTTLSNSHAGGIKLNELGGASEQTQYSGAQLFDDSNYRNITLGSGYYKLPIHITGAGTYTLSVDIYGGTENGITFAFRNESVLNVKTISVGTGSPKTFTVSEEEFSQFNDIAIYTWSGSVGATLNWIMLNAGDTALPYEPFVGNQPSPNPDYPQEIESVVVSQIKTKGKNFVVSVGLQSNTSYFTSNNIALESGTYTVSLTNNSANQILAYIEKVESGNVTTLQDTKFYISANAKNSKTFTLSEACTIRLAGRYEPASTFDITTISEVQIEKGTEATEYEPYQESTIDLSEPITLRGIGDYKDYIDVERGKVIRKIRHRRLLSSSDWGLHANGWIYSSDVTDFLYTEVASSGTLYFSEGTSTHFKYFHDRYPVINAESEGISLWYESSYNGHRCAIYSPSFSTVEELKTFLDENEVYIDYPLRTPTEEDLPTADQIALRNLSSFDTVTYISSDSEIEPSWNLEYGTSKVGAYTLEARNVAKRNEVALNELTTAVLALNQE